MSTQRTRQPAGQPTGGQYATTPKEASGLSLGAGEETFDTYRAAGTHFDRWRIAASLARRAVDEDDDTFDTDRGREDFGDAIDFLTPQQQVEALTRAERAAATGQVTFGAAVVDSAHDVQDDAESSWWEARVAGAARPKYSRAEIEDVYRDDPAKRAVMLGELDR